MIRIAARILAGGALVAMVGAASAAWACTPSPSLIVNDGEGNRLMGPPGSSVVVTATYPVTTPPSYFEGDTFVLDDGSGAPIEVAVPETGAVKVVHTFTLGASRNNYFDAYVKSAATGEVIASSKRSGVYVVEMPATPVETNELEPPVTTIAPPPAPGPEASPVGERPADPSTRPSVTPRRSPAAATAPASAAPLRPQAGPVGVGEELAPDVGTAVAPPAAGGAVPSASLVEAPDPSDLWSSVSGAARPPSLLDAPAPPKTSTVPVGPALLVLGVSAIAGFGLLERRRRVVAPARS